MNLRSIYYLFLAALLLIMAGCATPPSDTDAYPPEQAPAEATTTPVDLPVIDRADLPFRSMAEIRSATLDIGDYRPDQVMPVLRSLQPVSSGNLTEIISQQTYDPEFSEWLELSLLLRQVLVNNTTINEAARHWERFHYGHVIMGGSFADLATRLEAQYSAPSQVAVLLPESGGFSAAGRAIRDGILSAYLERPGESMLRFYPSGNDSFSALAAYTRAVEDGATQVIGPLRAESTRALAEKGVNEVPVLLLNDPGTNPVARRPDEPMINSLSLSQTEEAQIAAGQLLSQGLTRAVIVAAGNPWGQRIESAFGSTFGDQDGQIVASAYFDPASSDHSDVLTDLLKIDESKQRRRDLQSRLGIPLEFEPIRRDDFDFIYLVASPVQGRQLRPLFKFHDAGDIPVYAVGQVYSGRHESAADLDLDGVIFPITPWQLDHAEDPLPALDSLSDGSYSRLYALGRDAWDLLRWLPLLRTDPDLAYQGQVGSLKMHAGGKLARQPAWAQFSAGYPVPYRWQEKP